MNAFDIDLMQYIQQGYEIFFKKSEFPGNTMAVRVTKRYLRLASDETYKLPVSAERIIDMCHSSTPDSLYSDLIQSVIFCVVKIREHEMEESEHDAK